MVTLIVLICQEKNCVVLSSCLQGMSSMTGLLGTSTINIMYRYLITLSAQRPKLCFGWLSLSENMEGEGCILGCPE